MLVLTAVHALLQLCQQLRGRLLTLKGPNRCGSRSTAAQASAIKDGGAVPGPKPPIIYAHKGGAAACEDQLISDQECGMLQVELSQAPGPLHPWG